MKKTLIKKAYLFVMCSSLIFGSVGCAADGGLSAHRDNTFTGVKEIIQKSIEAENDKKNADSTTSAGEAEIAENTAEQADLTGQGEPSGEEIFYNGDEWLDPAFNNEQIDWSSSERGSDGIDIDLTQMSSTMVYSEVYYMMIYPERYIGKTIKADGEFATYLDEETNKMYYACIVKDATECCAQGLEFAPYDERKYPDDFPAEGDEVCVIGEFDTYMEGEDKFGVLKNAKMIYG